MPEYSVIGKRIPRIDALSKVTGAAIFSGDVVLPRMLHAKVLRSPYPHAHIRRLDVTKARDLKGVMEIITAEDVPGYKRENYLSFAQNPHMAKEKVIYAGQPIAVVAATSLHIAEKALERIEVEYEELHPILDIKEAMKPESPLIYPDLYSKVITKAGATKDSSPSNISWRINLKRGDLEQGFREAYLILEKTYHTEMVHQGYIEPMAAVASVDVGGKISIWTQSQGIFTARHLIADFLDLPLTRIKVIPVEIGGAFGGKTYIILAPLCALLALKTGRPVRIEMTRDEVLSASRPAPASQITIKLGVKKDGTLTAASAVMLFDGGAFPERPYSVNAALCGLGLYKIPNLEIEALDILTNKVPAGSYRSPAAPPAAFAAESQMDLIARTLDIDPIQLRLKNAVEEGDLLPDDTIFPRIGFKETLQRMADYLKQKGEMEGVNRGRGIACGFWRGGVGAFSVYVNVNSDGTVNLVVGSTDISGSRTTLAQIVAEELCLPFEAISVVSGDTDTAPYSDMSVGSRTLLSMGIAVKRACQDAIVQLSQVATQKLGVNVSEIEFSKGIFQVKGNPQKSITFPILAMYSIVLRGEGPICGQASFGSTPFAPAFAVHAADIEVDPETGKVKILSYAASQDVGCALNPVVVEGQIQGAVAQGIGWALMEGYVFKNGVMQNTSLLDYRMPTATDLPMLDVLIVEVPSPNGAYGLRPVGEPPMIPPIPTIANAIQSATGVRLNKLPMNPESIFNALKAHRK